MPVRKKNLISRGSKKKCDGPTQRYLFYNLQEFILLETKSKEK